MPDTTDGLPEYGPQPRPVLQQAPNNSGNRSSQIHQLQQQQQSFRLPSAPSSNSRWRSRSLVPSGFECVAHPVFFRTGRSSGGDDSGSGGGGGMMSRATTTTASGATNIVSHSSHDHEEHCASLAFIVSAELADNSSSSRNNDNGTAGGGESKRMDGISGGGSGAIARSTAVGGEREVDVVCPICLGRFDQPVTLTSCLHTFCHTCILGWYEHTVAVALAKGGMSGLLGMRPSGRGISTANITNNGNNRAPPVPYRCPLCQVPGPYFLAVEPASPALSKAAGKPKLKFRLLGARTVLGGGGPASGGVEVERADSGGDGVRRHETGYPSMVELRAAVRTQLALAAAVSALERTVAREEGKRKSGAECSAGDSDEGRKLDPLLVSAPGKKKKKKIRWERREAGGAKESGEHASRGRPAAGGVADLQECEKDRTDRHARKGKRRRRKGGGEDSERPDDCRANRRLDGEGKRCDSHTTGDGQLPNASNGSGVEQRLPWEPGSLAAEDALADIEAMLQREKEKLHRKTMGANVS